MTSATRTVGAGAAGGAFLQAAPKRIAVIAEAATATMRVLIISPHFFTDRSGGVPRRRSLDGYVSIAN